MGVRVFELSDEHGELISALYRALRAARAYAECAFEAERRGDSELSEFFDDARYAEEWVAGRARELLQKRLAPAAREASDLDHVDGHRAP